MRPHRLGSLLVSVCVTSAVALSGAVPAVAQSPAAPPPRTVAEARSLTVLTDLLAQRLLVADKVAAAKYGTSTPIDDPVREKAILDDVAARAAGLGLDPAAVTAVFRDQIEANKLVQRGLYARWDAHPRERPTERPDLVKEVRPVLDRITTGVLTALAETEPLRAGSSCAPRLRRAAIRSAYTHRLDLLHAEGLVRALPSVCGEPS
ncbi:chorismate mutase [Streptomyces heilongjiangensis]|uniref:Chorismate mutase n=1 Tax=Streptomyces heilongjiangensis TaxID=945052 RepID=A0ABW1B5X3_9ACTN|nr:chorismate mutase [Streptomyces heilongjiangensis]MDC2949256.1 chorismate mutase [Streptomyces heilongjiangensis]